MTRILSIQNRQRARPVAISRLRRITRAVLQDHLQVESHELGLHLVGAAEMARLNQAFLHHEGSTDVITFDHSESPPATPVSGTSPGQLHGELFISVPDAIAQAREFGTTWQEELLRYVIHGLLHLLGHDDRKPPARRVMKRAENRLVKALAGEHPIARLQRGPLAPKKRRLARFRP